MEQADNKHKGKVYKTAAENATALKETVSDVIETGACVWGAVQEKPRWEGKNKLTILVEEGLA
jgi:hypothetical protein